MTSSLQSVAGTNTNNTLPVLLGAKVGSSPDITVLKYEKQKSYFYFNPSGVYEKKCNLLLDFLNQILGKNYSFNNGELPIETIFDECKLDKINCNAGKKAYTYYLREVLQKLNLLYQHLLKGQAAFNKLNSCTTETELEKCKMTLAIQDELVKKYLEDFNKYTVIQTLTTTRTTTRKSISEGAPDISNSTNSEEVNYDIRGKIWDENGNVKGNFNEALENLSTLDKLRKLTTIKEYGIQSITISLKNKYSMQLTDLNDKFGFNVVEKEILPLGTGITPIASFDELTLLEKLQYIRTYYSDSSSERYFYPKNAQSGIPCMSRQDLEKYVLDTNGSNEGNEDELQALGIIPKPGNTPKADLVEPGAIELFYVGYLKDSMGAINALAAFMEIKSVSLLEQIEQQSIRIKALKTYLKVLEIGRQKLNDAYNKDEEISSWAYLAIRYAGSNQTRTLATINGEDYIVMQLDGEVYNKEYDKYHLTDKNTYIYVKATTEGINEFLGMNYRLVDAIFTPGKPFKDMTSNEKLHAKLDETKFYTEVDFSEPVTKYDYLYETISRKDGYTIGFGTMGIGEQNFFSDTSNTTHSHILFAKFTDKEEAIKHLPKELETVKVDTKTIFQTPYVANSDMAWDNRDTTENGEGGDITHTWNAFVESWQNVYQTATENIGSQIESVNKTIQSLRSKIDTFDSSASRFRDKFYSTTMAVINKLS